MANPVVVTIDSDGFTPCNVTLYQSNPGDLRPNSVKWVNNSQDSISWSCNTAAAFLATQAPPNVASPASPTATISASSSLTLWVKDNAATGVSNEYSLKKGSTTLNCSTEIPPDIMIEP
jgi:hypothetical protein